MNGEPLQKGKSNFFSFWAKWNSKTFSLFFEGIYLERNKIFLVIKIVLMQTLFINSKTFVVNEIKFS